MSLPRYPEYKDSGVEWLGEVPAHWTVAPLKRGFDVRLGKMLQPAQSSDEDVLAPYLRAANIQWGGVDLEDVRSMWFSPRERELLALQAGDLLVSEGGDVGRSSLWRAQMRGCYFQNSVNRVRARGQDRTGYLYYWMATVKAKGYVDVLCNKSTIAHFTAEKVAAVPTIFPEPQEQRQIATFLDRETAKIDALIAEQEKLLALLAEKRQATISHAVTRGLDPNVPMKDSGIPWLGDVPAHWEVLPIKRLSPVQRGASPRPIDDPRYFDEDGEYSWVRISDVTASDGVLRSTEQRLSELGASLSVPLQPGALFVSIAASVGKPCITAIKACIHDGFVYFPRLSIAPMFLFRVFEAGQCFAGLGKMGTQLNLNTETIGAIEVGLPPPAEMGAILKALADELSQIDGLQDAARDTLELLQERRSALIAAAVTGQIDVRGAVESHAA